VVSRGGTFLFYSGGASFEFRVGTTSTMTEVFRGFPRLLQESSDIVIQTTTASFRIWSNLLFTGHPNIWRCTLQATDSVFK
jgi:hypothetical protein